MSLINHFFCSRILLGIPNVCIFFSLLICFFSPSCVFCMKYLLYGPLLAKVLSTRILEGSFKDDWCLHILIICVARSSLHQLWSSYVTMLFLTRNRRINQHGYDFKQIDKEWDWYITKLLFLSVFQTGGFFLS